MCPANQTDRDEFSLTRQVRTWTPAWVLFLTLILCQEGSKLCQHSPTHQSQASWRKMKPTISWMSLKVAFLLSLYSFIRRGENPLGSIRESVFGWKEAPNQRKGITGKCGCQSRSRMSSPHLMPFFFLALNTCQIESNNVQNRIKYKHNYPKKAEEKCHLMVQGTQLQKKQELVCKITSSVCKVFSKDIHSTWHFQKNKKCFWNIKIRPILSYWVKIHIIYRVRKQLSFHSW